MEAQPEWVPTTSVRRRISRFEPLLPAHQAPPCNTVRAGNDLVFDELPRLALEYRGGITQTTQAMGPQPVGSAGGLSHQLIRATYGLAATPLVL